MPQTHAPVTPQAWPVGPETPLPALLRATLQSVTRTARRRRDLLIPLGVALGVRALVMAVATALLRLRHHHESWAVAWDRKDAFWYLLIAQSGYTYSPVAASRANFFPLYPALIALGAPVARALGLAYPYTMAGLFISWTTFAVACVLLYRLALVWFDRRAALGAVTLLAVFPFSFYYGAAYTEAIYLMLVAIAFLGVERRNWWLAAGAAGIASAVRPPGLILGACVGLAYALVWLRERRWLRWDMLSLALIPTGAAAYSLYCWVTFGDPLAYVKTSKAGWHSGIQFTGLTLAWRQFSDPAILSIVRHPRAWLTPGYTTITSHTVFVTLALVFLAAVPFVWRKLGPPYAAFLALSVLAPLLDFPTLNSVGRYLSVLFPAFFLLAYLLRRQPLILYGLALLCLIALIGYATLFIGGFGLS